MRRVITSATDQTIVAYCYDVDGAGVALTSGSAGLSVSVRVDQDGREGTPVSLTPVARDTAGVHKDSAITHVGDGKHEIDLPDTYFATADRVVTVEISATSVTGNVYAEKLLVESGKLSAIAIDAKAAVANTSPVT